MEEIKIGLQVVIVTTIVLIIAYKLCVIIGFHTQGHWVNDRPATMTEGLYACWGVAMLLALSVLCAVIIGITYGIGFFLIPANGYGQAKEVFVFLVSCFVILGLLLILAVNQPPSQEE